MYEYFVFGGVLRSELLFPDLSPSTARDEPTWTIRVSAARPTAQGTLQGSHEVQPGWVFRLYRLRNGLRLDYGTNGSYEILSEGSEIVWYQGTDRREELVRSVLLGPVMALALHESGILCLHGSAVDVDRKGIAFVAPKGSGKSTLAVALAAAGGHLMSDDIVAVTRFSLPEVIPGVHSVRMFGDVTEYAAKRFHGTVLRDGWKKTLTNLPRERLAWEPARLDVIYLLKPIVEPVGDAVTSRTRLRPAIAAVSLAHQTKLADDLVGYREAGTMLQWIAEIVSRVPVFTLEVVHDLERLPEVVREIFAWHRSDTASEARDSLPN
ncbi:MAG TPA: hypothetical protein VEY33_05290 [Gemmatimonadota bacterium]|nr:hypothetical protein [Gemmatimonadota bacterium]